MIANNETEQRAMQAKILRHEKRIQALEKDKVALQDDNAALVRMVADVEQKLQEF